MRTSPLLLSSLSLLLFFSLSPSLAKREKEKEKEQVQQQQVQEVDIVIIGAGLAGSELATLASSQGREFVVLEAKDVYGGRTQSLKIGGFNVPKGGGWQQGGGDQQPLTRRLNLCGMTTQVQNWNSWNDYNHDGLLVHPKYRPFNQAYSCAEQLSLTMQEEEEEDISMDTALKLCGWWKTSSDENYIIEQSQLDYEWADPSTIWGIYGQVPDPTYIAYTDEDVFITDQRGSEELTGCWFDRFLPDGGRNSPKIRYSDPVVNINTDDQIVTLESGLQYRYTVCFNTIPIQVLRYNLVVENGSLFTPPLSMNLKTALLSLDIPIYGKFFFQFKENFWGDSQFYNIASNITQGYSLWQNLDLPGFLPGSRILYLTLTSPYSNYNELLDDNQIIQNAVIDLKKVFGDDLPEIEDYAFSRWGNDPFARATYSDFPLDFTFARFDTLYAPFGTNESHILTGEAYCQYMNGYMHAAIMAAETSWCEYNSKMNGTNPANCRKQTFDADGTEYTNWCFDTNDQESRTPVNPVKDIWSPREYNKMNKGDADGPLEIVEFQKEVRKLVKNALGGRK